MSKTFAQDLANAIMKHDSRLTAAARQWDSPYPCGFGGMAHCVDATVDGATTTIYDPREYLVAFHPELLDAYKALKITWDIRFPALAA